MRVSGAATTRNVLSPALHRLYRIRLTGAHHVPTRGALVMVANHDGIVDATLLATVSPRPVHVVSEGGALTGIWERLSSATGRIVIASDADGPEALRVAVARVRDGLCVGMFPEGPLPTSGSDSELRPVLPGAAYVALRGDAMVLPVALLGTSGKRPTDPPRLRADIDVVYGEPFRPRSPVDAGSRSGVLEVSEEIRQRLSDHLLGARARTGRGEVGSRVEAGDNGAL